MFPYDEILQHANTDPEIDPAQFVAFAPEECWSQFSFASEHVTQDGAIASLLVCVEALRRIGGLVPGAWEQQIAWIDRELNRIWRLRGPFPGLGSALKAVGFEAGSSPTISNSRSARPTQNGTKIHGDTCRPDSADEPSLLSKGLRSPLEEPNAKSTRRSDRSDGRSYALLSRFDISEEQAKRLYQETEREKAAIALTDAEIFQNPYRITKSRSLSARSGGAWGHRPRDVPDPVVAARHPMEAPSAAEGHLDARRARALLVHELEEGRRRRARVQPRNHLIQAVRISRFGRNAR